MGQEIREHRDDTRPHAEAFVAAVDSIVSDSVARRCVGLLELVKWKTRTACVAVTAIDPVSHIATMVAHSDVPPVLADFLVSPAFMKDSAGLQRQLMDARRLNAWDDVGFPDTPEADRVFSSTGFRNGVSLPLLDSAGQLFGMVHANTTKARFESASRDVYLGLQAAFADVLSAVTSVRAARLTPREEEVLRLVKDGRTNAQIATQLSVAERTVATHIEHILHKVGAHNRVDAAVWACQVGL